VTGIRRRSARLVFWPRTPSIRALWRNEVTLRSCEMGMENEPGIYIERIAPTPLRLVVATEDTLTPTDIGLAAYERARGPKSLVLRAGVPLCLLRCPIRPRRPGRARLVRAASGYLTVPDAGCRRSGAATPGRSGSPGLQSTACARSQRVMQRRIPLVRGLRS
jgi:hypothetical protein